MLARVEEVRWASKVGGVVFLLTAVAAARRDRIGEADVPLVDLRVDIGSASGSGIGERSSSVNSVSSDRVSVPFCDACLRNAGLGRILGATG